MMQVWEKTVDDALRWAQDVARHVQDMEALGALTAEQAAWERKFLAEFRIYAFWGGVFHATGEAGRAVSINITRFSYQKRRRGAWGRYITNYATYTMPHHRRQGHGLRLQRYADALALDQGFDRKKSIAGTYGGFRLHWRLGDQFWGTNDKGELEVDTPLDPNAPQPAGVPIKVRKVGDHQLSAAELHAIVTNPAGVFRADAAEAARALGVAP